MATRHDIVHIDFQANAGKANVALQALQAEAEKARQKVDSLRLQLQNARQTNMPTADIKRLEDELKLATKESKQWQSALQNNMKGVRALDEAIKTFNNGRGTVEGMNAALSKTALNAAELQKKRSDAGSQTWKEMDALIVALQQNIGRCNTAMNSLVTTIRNGGTASRDTLTQAKNDLQQMIALEESGTKGWQKYTAQLRVVEGELNRITVEEQRAAGKGVLNQVFSGKYVTKTRGELERMIQTLRQYQSVIADPEGKGARHFKATETAIKSLTTQLNKAKEASAGQVLGNMSNFGIEHIRQATQEMTRLRDQFHEGTAEWNRYNALVKQGDAYLQQYAEREKIARGEAVSLAEALRMSSTAGTSGFTGTAQQLQLAQQAIERAIATTDKGTAKYQKLQQALSRVKAEMAGAGITSQRMQEVLANPRAEKSVETLKNAVARARAEMDVMGQRLQRLQALLQQAQQSGNVRWATRLSEAITQTTKRMDEMAASTRRADFAQKELANTAKGSATAFAKAWSRLKTYITLYMGAAVAIQKITATFGDVMELSDKMGEVRKTTGLTADQVGRLSENLKKMDVRTSLTELMEVAASAGQLGLKSLEDIEGFTVAANKLMVALPEMGKEAATEMMRVAIATGEVDKISKQLQEGTIEGSNATAVAMEKIASTIDRLRASSASTAPEITDFVKRVGAVGAQSGITIDQVAALGSTVSSLGMRVEMSATALSRMIPAIRNNAFSVAKAIGVTPETLRNLFDTGRAMEAILMIFQHIKDTGKDADSIEQMLGMGGMQEVMKELNQMGARAGIVFAGLSQNVEELKKQLGIASQAYKENTAIQNEFNRMNETTAAKWARLKNELEETFVGDSSQRGLGMIIDGLRNLVNFISGRVSPELEYLRGVIMSLTFGWGIFKLGLGEAVFVTLIARLKSFGETLQLLAMYTKENIALRWQLVRAHTAEEKAAIRAKIATQGLGKAMNANVFMAVVAAIGMLIYKLNDWRESARQAAIEAGKFNQKIADEQKALNNLFEPLRKSNTAHEERSKLISDINSKYSKYLGYMLSETSSAIQLADAHALIAKRIREEAYERRIMEQERKVQEEHNDDLNESYAKITERVRGSVRNGTDPQQVADILKGIVDNRVADIKFAYDNRDNFFTAKTSYMLDPKIKAAIDGGIERLIVDGKLSRDNVNLIQKAVYRYTVDAKSQHDAMMSQTANVRSDLRNIKNAISTDLTNNLSSLITNVTNSVSNAVRQVQQTSQGGQQQNVPLMLQQPQGGQQGGGLPSLWGGNNQQGGASWQAPWQSGGSRPLQDIQMPAPGWKPQVNIKNIAEVRAFVDAQDQLRGYLQANAEHISEQQRATAEAYLLADSEMEKYRKALAKANANGGGGGGGGGSVWGSEPDAASTDWKNMSADVLVNRRKQMNEFVKAIQTDTDVQAVLKEDAALKKAIENGMASDMRTVINWYNTERLKIQDELHARFLTNTGDWMDPKKQKAAHKQFKAELDAYLEELDAYYTERKTEIETARSQEEITEGEAWRRNLRNENEWYQRRAELMMLYGKDAAEVTAKEQEAIVRIIAERTGESEEFVRAMIKKTIGFAKQIEQSGEKGAAMVHDWMAKLDLDTQRSFLKSQQAITKQMKFIEDTLAKERPYDGITKNLQDNLDKMGVLAAQMRRVNDELTRQDKQPKYSDAEITAQSYKEMAFYLNQAADAYSIDINELLRRMTQEGMAETAKEIEQSDLLKQAVMGQLRKTYQEVQDAIKKEASQIKKDVEILWNDDTLGPDGRSIKATFDKASAALGMQQDSVARANSLIGAGAASDNVASRLAMKQIEVQMRMQKAQFDMFRNQANQRMAALRAEAKEHKRLAALAREKGDIAEAERETLAKTNALRDAENVRRSLGLTLAEETKKEEEQKAELLKLQEESQNRLYTSLREWADLLTSSLQQVMEAEHAGDAEYYNERAKLDLTGKGGPGAGTYVVIDNAGTSDAQAHYEYLDERQALERQHEIEIENARAEAWKKVWDDLNMKMNEQITDWLNSAAQQAALESNSEAVNTNTAALNNLTSAVTNLQTTMTMQGAMDAAKKTASSNAPNPTIERIGYEDVQPVKTTTTETTTTTEQTSPFLPGVTPGEISWVLPDDMLEAERTQLEERVRLQEEAAEKVRKANESAFHGVAKTEGDTGKQMVKSSQSTYAKMALAANMYGIAYQAMSNDNLSATQKFEMIALQSVGNFAISSLTAFMSKAVAEGAVNEATVLGKLWSQLGWAAAPVFAIFTGLLGAAMGAATSSVTKSKAQIAQATGASSASAGRLSTGMLTYAEGNVNELTDPASLTPGRTYNVDAADGRTYRAKYTGANPRTHITNGAEFHLVGERGREAIIDAHTTRLLQMDDTGIWQSIQTLYNGGSLAALRRSRNARRGRGMAAFADGNLDDFNDVMGSDMGDGMGDTGMSMDVMVSMQETNSRLADLLEQALTNGIKAVNNWHGPDGIPNMYNKMQKEATRHGVKYL